jgi:uncharacterized protein
MSSKRLPVEVRDAKHGLGVFATRKIRRGTVISEIHGRIIPDENYTSRYVMEMGNGQQLEPEAPFRFVNHSCTPNCELMYYDPETLQPDQEHLRDKLFIHVIRSITPGEELSIDYAWPADHAIPCGCDALKCRGWIVDIDELHLVDETVNTLNTIPA